MGEWLIPPDCKSGARKGYVGSNPTPSTKPDCGNYLTQDAHIAQSVERVLGKNEVSSSSLLVGSMRWRKLDGQAKI